MSNVKIKELFINIHPEKSPKSYIPHYNLVSQSTQTFPTISRNYSSTINRRTHMKNILLDFHRKPIKDEIVCKNFLQQSNLENVLALYKEKKKKIKFIDTTTKIVKPIGISHSPSKTKTIIHTKTYGLPMREKPKWINKEQMTIHFHNDFLKSKIESLGNRTTNNSSLTMETNSSSIKNYLRKAVHFPKLSYQYNMNENNNML